MARYNGTKHRDEIDLRFDMEAATVDGDDGNDWILGTAFDDNINGGRGDDELYGLGGWDLITGGSGNDKIFGGSGADILFGDSGNDVIYGGSAFDQLFGGDGNDVIYGEEGGDWIRGDRGDDRIYGGARTDEISGGEGDDTLYGGDDDDYLWGDEDWDTLYGGSGNDFLDGGSWADTLDGGAGHDRLTGGSGGDRFVFSDDGMATASIRLGTGPLARTITYEYFETDTVTDFQTIFGDRLDVSSLISSETSFRGSGAADAVVQGFVYWVQHGTPGQSDFGTMVYVDRDGGAHNPNGLFGTGDLAIADLQGVAGTLLNATYFIV